MYSNQPRNQDQRVVRSILKMSEDSVCGSLWILEGGEGLGELASNAIRDKVDRISPRYLKLRRLQRGQLGTDDAATQEKSLLHSSLPGTGTDQHRAHISDAQPGHPTVRRID